MTIITLPQFPFLHFCSLRKKISFLQIDFFLSIWTLKKANASTTIEHKAPFITCECINVSLKWICFSDFELTKGQCLNNKVTLITCKFINTLFPLHAMQLTWCSYKHASRLMFARATACVIQGIPSGTRSAHCRSILYNRLFTEAKLHGYAEDADSVT